MIVATRGQRGMGGLGNLQASDLYSLARGAGFPADTAVKMTAIALKESSGDPTAHNTTGPDDSYGLWQINMKGNLGPARLSQFGISSASQLFDPATNARAAYLIWGGNDANLSAWAIYTQDQAKYQQFLPTAQQAAQIVDGYGSQLAQVPQISSQDQTPGLDWTGTLDDYLGTKAPDTSVAGVGTGSVALLLLAAAGVVVMVMASR